MNQITLKFCKQLAFMLGIVPNMSMNSPITKSGDKIDVTKIDMFRNTLNILWVLAYFIEPTIAGQYLTPLLRMVPIQQSDRPNRTPHVHDILLKCQTAALTAF